MGTSLAVQHERQQIRTEIAEMREREAAAAYVVAQYEALDPETRTKRRQPTLDQGPEDVWLVYGYQRLKGIAMCREIMRRSSLARAIVTRLVTAVVGTGAKCRFHGTDVELNRDFAEWVNRDWSKPARCDATERFSFCELQELMLTEYLTTGMAMAWLDPATGAVRLFDTEQLRKVRDFRLADGWQQRDGIMLDPVGAPRFYAVTSNLLDVEVSYRECTLIPAAEVALLRAPDRYTNYHGIPPLLSLYTECDDVRRLINIEMQSAQAAAAFAVALRKEAPAAQSASRNGVATSSAPQAYPAWEKQFGGRMQYLAEGERVDLLTSDRPNQALDPFVSFLATLAGSALGLPISHTLLRTAGSYSAARNEANQAGETYDRMQKLIERRFYDPAATLAIEAGREAGVLPRGYDPGAPAWTHPKQRAVDPLKEANARKQLSSIGDRTLSDSFGDWMARIEQRGLEAEAARKAGAPLPQYENPEAPSA